MAARSSRWLSAAEAAQNRSVVFATYRALRRAILFTFRGDLPLYTSAVNQVRASFRDHMGKESGSTEVTEAIEHAQGITKMLRENVVQAKQSEKDPNLYKARITEETQKFDNEQTKLGKGTVKSFKEIKNAQF